VDLIIYRRDGMTWTPVLCVSGAADAPAALAKARRDPRYTTAKLRCVVASECSAEDVAAARAAK
jgi:hypothetical protein